MIYEVKKGEGKRRKLHVSEEGFFFGGGEGKLLQTGWTGAQKSKARELKKYGGALKLTNITDT